MSVVDRVYARALYDAAKERGRVEAVRHDLDDFVVTLREVPELRAVLRNPQLDPRAKASAVDAIVEGGDELVSNFLRLLAEKGRAGEVEEIAREFERMVAAEQGQLTVELTTAHELTDEEARSIVAQIERSSGRKVEVTRSVDPGLIGGVVLQAGSFRLDASVRGRLNGLRRELATRS
jgi:F-type H+-transporting ATPase subunit delta